MVTVTFQQLVESVKNSTEIDITEETERDDTNSLVKFCVYHILYFHYNYESGTVIRKLFFKKQHGGITYGIRKVEGALENTRNNLIKNIYNMIKDGLEKEELWGKRLVLK